jgi:hypothetical protein
MAAVCAQMIVEATTKMMVASIILLTGITFKVLITMAQVVICLDVHPQRQSTTPIHRFVFADVALVALAVKAGLHHAQVRAH